MTNQQHFFYPSSIFRLTHKITHWNRNLSYFFLSGLLFVLSVANGNKCGISSTLLAGLEWGIRNSSSFPHQCNKHPTFLTARQRENTKEKRFKQKIKIDKPLNLTLPAWFAHWFDINLYQDIFCCMFLPTVKSCHHYLILVLFIIAQFLGVPDVTYRFNTRKHSEIHSWLSIHTLQYLGPGSSSALWLWAL